MSFQDSILAKVSSTGATTLALPTWQLGAGFVYDLKSFGRKAEFHHEGEGWALTQDHGADLHERRHLAPSRVESQDLAADRQYCRYFGWQSSSSV